MTEDELKKFLADNNESIKAEVHRKLVEGLVNQHQWEIRDNLSKTVNEFIAAEIAPGVKDFLQAEKGAILAASIEGARQICNKLTETMVKKASENMGSYQFGELLKSLFR